MISALWDWASGQVTDTVIWAYQDGDQPSAPYVTLHVMASTREGSVPYVGAPDNTGVAVIAQGQLITLSINTYGDGATGIIQTLRNSLEKITVQRDLRIGGFAFVDVLSEPRDLPSLTGTTWQQRAQMDVQFRAAVNIEDDVGIIETVGFEGGDGTASDTGATVGGA